MEDVKKCANIWEGSDYKKTGKGIEVRVLKESMGSSYVLLEMGECPPPPPPPFLQTHLFDLPRWSS